MFRSLRPILSVFKPTLSAPIVKRASRSLFVLPANKFQLQWSTSMNNFSTTSKNDELLEDLLNDIQSERVEHTEEPYVPDNDMNQITALRRSIGQNINLGNYKQAHEEAYSYIQIIRKYYGANHPAFFSALNNLALIYKLVGEFQNAKLLYTKIMEGYLQIFGSKHISTITVMQNLANLMREMQEFDSAITLYEDVLGLRKDVQPEKRTEQAVCLSSMAGAYREIRNFEKSEKCLEEALEIFLKEFGEYHLNTATCLNNMGLTYKKQKKFEKSEESYLRALRIREQLLEEIHPDIIAIKHNLGELYLAMGNEEKARDFMIEAMEGIKKLEERHS